MTAPIPLEYQDLSTTCKGWYIRPESAGETLPVVMACPAWDGLGEELLEKATRLSAEGYIVMGVDVHGNGRTYTDMADLESALGPFLSDRAMLLRRLEAAVAAARTIPGADPSRIGAIGYCFGGACALDLARAGGQDIKTAVSFHGLLSPSGLEAHNPISAHVLVLHGHDDPLVPPEQLAAFQREMTDRQADWQLVSYGHTVHAFTRPGANNPDFGAVYNAVADRRSWQAMLNFLAEVL